MSLVLRREGSETWREAAIRQASKFSMQDDVAASFDAEAPVTENDHAQAAWSACYEWDVLDLEDRP